MLMPFWNVSEFFLLVTIKLKKKMHTERNLKIKVFLKKLHGDKFRCFPELSPTNDVTK